MPATDLHHPQLQLLRLLVDRKHVLSRVETVPEPLEIVRLYYLAARQEAVCVGRNRHAIVVRFAVLQEATRQLADDPLPPVSRRAKRIQDNNAILAVNLLIREVVADVRKLAIRQHALEPLVVLVLNDV